MSEGSLALPRPAAPQPLLRMLPDDRLATMAAQGSAPAFAAIYARHHQQVYRYCRSILRNEHDARDALQSTMEKAFRALDGEQREIALRPWLFRIAHNESVSMLRARTPAASMERAEAELPAADADPETRQRLRELIEDLELLTARQRSALVMRELSGLEFAEIGGALETSPEGAKQAVYEARVALHALVEGREMTCADIRQKISADDRRLLRGRKVRAHLRVCEECRCFEIAVGERKQGLAAIAPPLSAPAAVAILNSILGGGGFGGGALASGGGVAGALGGSAVMKAGAAGIAALAVGAGVYAESKTGTDPLTQRGAAQQQSSQTADHGSASAAVRGGSGRADGRSGAEGQGNGKGGNGDKSEQGTEGKAGGSRDGATDDDGAAGGAPAPEASTPAAPAAEGGGSSGSSGGPTGTPPGQGGTPPGQGGVPPGLGDLPPGLGGPNPGQGGGPPVTPPGQGGIPPGQGGTSPGQDGGPPVTPPGQGGTAPGQGGTPPGQS